MNKEHSLEACLRGALATVSRSLRQDATLGPEGGVAFRIGNPPVDVVVEWIEAGRCVAVHAPFLLPQQALASVTLPSTLMKVQLAGAGTMGCSFWMTPNDELRVGLTLIGPRTDEEQLIEAIGRVEYMARAMLTRIGG